MADGMADRNADFFSRERREYQMHGQGQPESQGYPKGQGHGHIQAELVGPGWGVWRFQRKRKEESGIIEFVTGFVITSVAACKKHCSFCLGFYNDSCFLRRILLWDSDMKNPIVGMTYCGAQM